MHQTTGSNEIENCLCFNYFENGVLINTKYRSALKHFRMVTGAELIPYNIDAIADTPECIITEGEFDACAFMTAGRKDVISVPAGAQSNLTWMDRFVESHFEPKKVIYIAADEDGAGQALRHELVRRLGAERCRLVHFGPGCKDANEHLILYGAQSLLITLAQAEEIPLEGVFTAEDYREDLRALFENGCAVVPIRVGKTLMRTALLRPGGTLWCREWLDTGNPNSSTNLSCASACAMSGR